ncbi:MAG: glycoside hydrolase family 3 N-terminal domain-containing protein, partial [Myxococcota bacterium]
AHARAYARGLAASGMLSCGKHFPGHGDTRLDSHFALPTITHERARLNEVELAPFAALASELPAIMTAHIVVTALDAVPATLSPKILQGLLRDELGFQGAIISDDLEMKAVAAQFSLADAALRSIEAGCDLVLICSDLAGAFDARAAIAERAERDETFAKRLEDAARRSLRLRRSAPPAPAKAFPFAHDTPVED